MYVEAALTLHSSGMQSYFRLKTPAPKKPFKYQLPQYNKCIKYKPYCKFLNPQIIT